MDKRASWCLYQTRYRGTVSGSEQQKKRCTVWAKKVSLIIVAITLSTAITFRNF